MTTPPHEPLLEMLVPLKEVYAAIHGLHKSSTLERCWLNDCDCEKIWKAVKEKVQ